MMSDAPRIKVKLQILHGNEIAMGPGKADLLEAIDALGSISAAARSMSMSYRRAWLLVDVMNRCWRVPLVATAPGAAGGRGARLTDEGRHVLSAYRELIDAAQQSLDEGVLADLTGRLTTTAR